jgi:transcriptional regulator with PAS, ATPase and Fis domain
MIGATRAMKELFRRIERYAPTDAPVVITGETGAGKEMVARALHKFSNRKNNAFVAINCTALHEELLESELFGHEKGAFTGAVKTHRGRFERAHNGTLFLDEIGDMPHSIQVKLLRVLEERKFERIGGETLIPVDVRVIAATNVPLEKVVGSGRFRSDLYHRLAVLRIHVPALRDRKRDIPLLVDFFLEMLNHRYKKNIRTLSPESLQLLLDYHWPGNIRELRNVLERVYVETEGDRIERDAFTEWVTERDYLSVGAWSLQNYEYSRLSDDTVLPRKGSVPGWYGGAGDRRLPEPLPRALIPYRAGVPPEGDPDAGPGHPGGVIDGEFQVVSEGLPPRKKPAPPRLTPDLLRKAFRMHQGNITAASNALGIHKATFYRYMKKFGLDRDSL